jgi:hypothetical protein
VAAEDASLVGLERHGLKGLAAVVENRIQVLGGDPHVESVVGRAARLQRKMDLDEAKRRFRDSEIGVAAARAAFEQLTASLKRDVGEIASERLAGLKFREIGEYWNVSGLGPWLTIHWWRRYTNTLDGSLLEVTLYNGVPRLPGIMPAFQEGRRLQARKFEYNLSAPERHGFVEQSDLDRSYSGEELAAHILKLYLNAAEKFKC